MAGKLDSIKALREAKFGAKRPEPKAAKVAKVKQVVEAVSLTEQPKPTRAKFDRAAYQRELMRKRRASNA
jgi:hypothetical protein